MTDAQLIAKLSATKLLSVKDAMAYLGVNRGGWWQITRTENPPKCAKMSGQERFFTKAILDDWRKKNRHFLAHLSAESKTKTPKTPKTAKTPKGNDRVMALLEEFAERLDGIIREEAANLVMYALKGDSK